jgi:hypothetical protein
MTIIAKDPSAPPAVPALVCPCYGDPLTQRDGVYFSSDSLRAYPVLRGIPCLRPEKAIVAAAFADETL